MPTYGQDEGFFRSVWYTGTDELFPGYALCYNFDTTDVRVTGDSGLPNRSYHVEKPNWYNLDHFAGVVRTGEGGKTGPCEVQVVRPFVTTGVPVWTDGNVSVGDFLGLQANSYAMNRGALWTGVPLGRALEAQDRSSTNGQVVCEYGALNVGAAQYSEKVTEIVGFGPDLSTYTLTQATAGTMILEDGKLEVNAGSSTDTQGANMQSTYAAFQPKAANDLLYYARFKVDDVSAPDFLIGLAELDTTIIPSSAVTTANHMAFYSLDAGATLDFATEKGGTTQATADILTVTDGDYFEIAMHLIGVTTLNLYGAASGSLSATKLSQDASWDISTDLPIVNLAMSLVVVASSETTDATCTVSDWFCRQVKS